jgi:class 3 adenylate cyclase
MSWGAVAGLAALALAAAAGVMTALGQTMRLRRSERRVGAAEAELERLQRMFGRFVPAEVVEDVASRGVDRRGQLLEVTVLFADLQDFTQLSEQLAPSVLVEMLNGYFEVMSAAISSHHGHVGKFIGDGLMAFFGALDANPWANNDAAHAALAMRAALAQYNQVSAARGYPPLRFGVGIHRGPAIAGFIGSQELLEYTLIGDTVNTTARIEALTRKHGTDILLTQEARVGIDARLRLTERPPAPVKGKREPIVTFALEG